MVSDANRIEATLKERLSAHANNLLNLKGQFLLYGVPSEERFTAMVNAFDLVDRYPGSLGVGYASLDQGSVLQAPVKMLEPNESISRRTLGQDLLADDSRKRAILQAIHSGDVVLSDPLPLSGAAKEKSVGGFGLFLAVYRKGFDLNTQRERSLDNAVGVVFAPFRIRDFFDGAFGAPSLETEMVNFSFSSKDEHLNSLTYNRFNISRATVDPWMMVERPVDLFGRKMVLRVYPLPHFYSFADRYLALLVGLGAALISCLILIVMKVGQNQLEFETLAKEASIQATAQGRRQIENLRRLNEFDRGLVGELEIGALEKKFYDALKRVAKVDASFLYLKPSAVGDLSLRAINGVNVISRKIDGPWVDRLFTQALSLRKGGPGTEEVLRSLVDFPGQFSDWLLCVVSTREGGRCGLVFVAREEGNFGEIERELFESMLSQFAAALEISQLFLRVDDASKAKNAFLANMSHEIRTPLSAIIGFSEILTKDGISTEQKYAAADNVRRNGQQLTAIIDDILDLSKVEAGKLKIEKRQISLSAVVNEVRSMLELRAESKGVELTFESVGSLPLEIETDEVRLKQILVNIAGNALKFTERGFVKVLVRQVRGKDSGHCLVFTVKDSGIGISDDAQSKLFLPFSQGDMSTTRLYGGSGLGLALSRRLAQELGGDIQLIESIKGQGSTFEVRIFAGDLSQVEWSSEPFANRNMHLAKKPDNAPRLDGARILVVEDSEDNQEIFRYFLEGSGACTSLVGNGLRAVDAAFGEAFDMILMDIQIPGIDGKEATRRIRERGFLKPIVALTAHAMAEEQESCRMAGCDGQITKPVSGEGLITQVAEFLGRA